MLSEASSNNSPVARVGSESRSILPKSRRDPQALRAGGFFVSSQETKSGLILRASEQLNLADDPHGKWSWSENLLANTQGQVDPRRDVLSPPGVVPFFPHSLRS